MHACVCMHMCARACACMGAHVCMHGLASVCVCMFLFERIHAHTCTEGTNECDSIRMFISL